MQILEQLDDRKFVVELEDCDFDKSREMQVAHDYVRFLAMRDCKLNQESSCIL